MSAPAHIARENGKKGGRPKGGKASHTLMAEKGREELIRMYLENIKPINEALLNKAKAGDIQAIKELHDRVYGRPFQGIELSGKNGGPIQITGMKIIKTE